MASLLGRIIRRISSELATSLGVWIRRVEGTIAQKTLPQFGNNPRNLTIELPSRIVNAKLILIGDDVWLGPNSFLSAVTECPAIAMQRQPHEMKPEWFQPTIRIGHRVSCAGRLVLRAVHEVVIEDDVLIASNVTILDHQPGYRNVDEPYKSQSPWRVAPVLIKQGSWIGQNVVIMSGVTIGEFSIIGANSVVPRNLPDRCIAVGAPARVIKRWDTGSESWVADCEGRPT